MPIDDLDSRHRLSVRSYASTTLAHQHDFHQVILPCKGLLELQCGPHTGEAAQHCAALVAAGETHTFSAPGENAFWVLDIQPEEQHQRLFDKALSSPFVALPPHFQQQLIFAEHNSQLADNPLIQHHWVQLILASIDAHHAGGANTLDKRLHQALRTMEQQLHRPQHVEEIAKQVHLSSSQLHRLFRQHLHCSPQRWLVERRMQRAADQLFAGYSPAQTALQCGYADQSSFGKAFKRFYGAAPARWLTLQSGEPRTKKTRR